MPHTTRPDASSLVDDLIRQHKHADGSQWIKKLDLRSLEAWPEPRRAELVGYVMDRMSTAALRQRELYPDPYEPPIESATEEDILELENEDHLLRKLFNHLVLLNGWPLSLGTLDRLLGVLHRTGQGYIDTDPLIAYIAAHADAYRPSADAASAIKRLLSGFLALYGRGDQIDKEDDRMVVASLQKLLGNAPLAFAPDFPANALMLAELGTDPSPAWVSLVNHCVTCPKSRPDDAWLKRATDLLTSIPSGEFTRHAARWLDALEQPVILWPNHPGWKIGEREEAWLSGLAWCISFRPAQQTLAALGRACVACLKPSEYGQRSRLLASVCVQAIEHADHAAAAKVLLSLKPKVKHKMVLSAIEKAVDSVAHRGAAPKRPSPAKRRAT